MTAIVIALARDPRDVAAVQDLFREFVYRIGRELRLDVSYQGFADEMARFPATYAALFLARVDDAPAAAIGLKRLDAATAELKRLYCRDAFRGLGLARSLCDRAITQARAAGCKRLVLDTHDSMAAAIALYQSFGFAPSPPHNDPGNPGTLFFAKDL